MEKSRENAISSAYSRFEESYWWFRARRRIIEDQLLNYVTAPGARDSALDLGCGTGGNLGLLGLCGKVYGLDSSHEALSYCSIRACRVMANATELPFKPGTFRVVAALDILEHLDEPGKCLAEIVEALEKGGALVVTVPAYQFMFSPYADRGHKKRYLASEVRALVEDAGLEVLRLTYFNTLLFPVMLAERLWEKTVTGADEVEVIFRELPVALNRTLDFIFGLEKFILRFVRQPFGGSILCIARKRG